jgi:Holliday junction resolvase RusA-like endonuclease
VPVVPTIRTRASAVSPPKEFIFAVQHRAAPQGSKDLRTKADGSKYMAESSAGVKPFRTAVRRAALNADRPQFLGPVLVGIVFEFKQAKSNEDPYPTGRNIGDLDKLTRAVLDALTEAKVIEDDSFVVGWLGTDEPSKLWGDRDQVIITVRPVPVPTLSDFVEKHFDVELMPWQKVVLDEVYGPCVGCGEGDEGNHSDGTCVLGRNGA